MLEKEACESVATLREQLRPFVERRVRVAADVDDVLQDIFLRVHRGLPNLRDAERFGPWIYRVARNAITDRSRAQRREAKLTGEETAPADDDGLEAADRLAACIAPFVARLPSPYREAVALVDIEGVAHKAAARMLGLSVPGVKSRVQRGRAKLRGMFAECCRLEFDARRRLVAYQCRPGKDSGYGDAC